MEHTTIELIIIIIIIPVFWSIVIAILRFVLKLLNTNITIIDSLLTLLSTCSFSLMGFVTGWLIGLSKAHTVSAIMPAIFTFFTGFTIFLFSNKNDNSLLNRIVVLSIIGAFSLWLILGVEVGIKRRLHDEIIDYELKNKTGNKIIDVQKDKIDMDELMREIGEE